MSVLSEEYTKMVIYDELLHKEIAVITNAMITTADDHIVVKLTPSY